MASWVENGAPRFLRQTLSSCYSESPVSYETNQYLQALPAAYTLPPPSPLQYRTGEEGSPLGAVLHTASQGQ